MKYNAYNNEFVVIIIKFLLSMYMYIINLGVGKKIKINQDSLAYKDHLFEIEIFFVTFDQLKHPCWIKVLILSKNLTDPNFERLVHAYVTGQ